MGFPKYQGEQRREGARLGGEEEKDAFFSKFRRATRDIGSDREGVVRWREVVVFVVEALVRLAFSISWPLMMVAAAVCVVHGDGAQVMGGTSLGVAFWWDRGQMVICLGSFVFDYLGVGH